MDEEEPSTDLLIVREEYFGSIDGNGLRSCDGCQNWKKEYCQKYRGQFLLDNIHGEGTYTIENPDAEIIYNGLFYTNSLEGYGQIVYKDGHYFEGLFKKQRRFGPGIYTYPDGYQDVGLWNGTTLIRLSCLVKPSWVPRIAKSSLAKARVLKYRKLVSICKSPQDLARDILLDLNANETIMENSNKLYNIYVRDRNSKFFNRCLYDDDFFPEKDCIIEVAMNPEEILAVTITQHANSLRSIRTNNSIMSVEESLEESIKESKTYLGDFCLCADYRQIRVDELRTEMQKVEGNLEDLHNTIECIKIYLKSLESRSEEEGDTQSDIKTIDKYEICGENAQSFWNKIGTIEEAQNRLTHCLQQENFLVSKRSVLIKILEKWCCCIGEDEESENKIENIEEKQTEDIKIKKIVVSDLLAWNNEKISMDILKHSFLHRNSENNVSFNVSKVLIGDRKQFRQPGRYEEHCVEFLKYCSDGKNKRASDLYRRYNINPDLCDSRGNTGIVFATARDKINIIKMLVNFGANLDIFNDEGFTPLTLCLTRYLTVQYKVKNWEKTFLPTTIYNIENQMEVNEWNMYKSISNISNLSSREQKHSIEIELRKSVPLIEGFKSMENIILEGSSILQIQNSLTDLENQIKLMQFYTENLNLQEPYVNEDDDEPFMFNTSCILPPKKSNKKKGKKSKKPKKKEKSDSKSSKKKNDSKSSKKKSKIKKSVVSTTNTLEIIDVADTATTKKLEVIFRTLSTLLKFGANPNTGEMPLPPLILSVFTKNSDVVRILLEYQANPDVTNLDENMTALHYIVSLPPCFENVDICKVLLQFSANVNCKTNIFHWMEQKAPLLGKNPLEALEVEDNGKTPLHLLCMRYDYETDTKEYLHQIAEHLISFGADVNDFYLGHTPLTLAMMRGNVKLIQTILKTKKINANQNLGADMGVPLTVLILKRFQNILPLETATAIYDTLLEHGANPLNDVNEIGNTVEFMYKEHEVIKKETKGKKGKNKKGSKKSSKTSKKSAKSSKSSKKNKKSKENTQDILKEYLKKCAKDTLSNFIKFLTTKYLYDFVYEDIIEDEFSETLAKMILPAEAVKYLQILIHSRKIKKNHIDQSICYELIEFVKSFNQVKEKPKKKKQKKKQESATTIILNTEEILQNMEFTALPKTADKYFIYEPGLDKNKTKYIVCFYCLKKVGKELIVCPECEMVYFCSEECNKLSNKQQTLHKCKTVFYNQEKLLQEERMKRGEFWAKPSRLSQKLAFVKEQRDKRYQEMLLEKQKDKTHGHGTNKDKLSKADTPYSTKATSLIELYKESFSDPKGLKRKYGAKNSGVYSEEFSSTIKKHSCTTKSKKESKKSSSGKGSISGGKSRSLKSTSSKFSKRSTSVGSSSKHKRSTSAGSTKIIKDSSPVIAQKPPSRCSEKPKSRLRFDSGHGDRLPDKNRYLIEKLSQYFPDFDMAALFLPYVCFSNGQLFYRFLEGKYIFVPQTYSDV